MADKLKELKERSQKRRALLAQQYGVDSPDGLSRVISSKEEQDEKKALKRSTSGSLESPLAAKRPGDQVKVPSTSKGTGDTKDPQGDDAEVEEIYTDSSAFLKGTQSANPHNDYCQHFVDTGERPQNFIRDVGLSNRFEEYPKLRELILHKDEQIQKTNTPPMYLKCDLETFDLRDLESKFDVILIEPPLEEYQRTLGVTYDKYWGWDMIEKLEIEQIVDTRAFIWIWCGSSDGLDAGRRCLKKWGFRRCEDICWIKTNIKSPGHNKNLELKAIFQRTKEHCLMGIHGTVRRSTDGDFIHANIDIDLVIAEEEPWGSAEKPVEIFHIIEHFCLGRRRLHLFGRDTSIRPGWLTVGPHLTSSNFNPDTYAGFFSRDGCATGTTEDIERLRPKSPPAKGKGGGGGAGGGGVGNNVQQPAMTMPPIIQGAPIGGSVPRGAPPMMHGAIAARLAPPPRSNLPPMVRGPVGPWPPVVGAFVHSGAGGPVWPHGPRTYLPPRS